jgi:hypothetical protein
MVIFCELKKPDGSYSCENFQYIMKGLLSGEDLKVYEVQIWLVEPLCPE